MVDTNELGGDRERMTPKERRDGLVGILIIAAGVLLVAWIEGSW